MPSNPVFRMNADGSLAVEASANADVPIAKRRTRLLTCDVWEHAYYVDYTTTVKIVAAFWHLANWDFVATNLMAVDAVAAVAIRS